jgi:L-ascorbate metabolism protein UlaG (beta-lactamase superfamily)
MRLTKMGHACVRLEKDGEILVIDPGTLTEPEALDGAEAVLITHEHPDHVDRDRLKIAAQRTPQLEIWTTAALAGQLEGLGANVHAVGGGDAFGTAGFDLAVFGELHAVINPAWPRVANVGFLIDGTTFHPGDAYTVPKASVETLLLPTSAPWLKAPEFIDYVAELSPRRAYSVHDGFLNEKGLALVDGILGSLAEERHADIRRLEPGAWVDLP